MNADKIEEIRLSLPAERADLIEEFPPISPDTLKRSVSITEASGSEDDQDFMSLLEGNYFNYNDEIFAEALESIGVPPSYATQAALYSSNKEKTDERLNLVPLLSESTIVPQIFKNGELKGISTYDLLAVSSVKFNATFAMSLAEENHNMKDLLESIEYSLISLAKSSIPAGAYRTLTMPQFNLYLHLTRETKLLISPKSFEEAIFYFSQIFENEETWRILRQDEPSYVAVMCNDYFVKYDTYFHKYHHREEPEQERLDKFFSELSVILEAHLGKEVLLKALKDWAIFSRVHLNADFVELDKNRSKQMITAMLSFLVRYDILEGSFDFSVPFFTFTPELAYEDFITEIKE